MQIWDCWHTTPRQGETFPLISGNATAVSMGLLESAPLITVALIWAAWDLTCQPLLFQQSSSQLFSPLLLPPSFAFPIQRAQKGESRKASTWMNGSGGTCHSAAWSNGLSWPYWWGYMHKEAKKPQKLQVLTFLWSLGRTFAGRLPSQHYRKILAMEKDIAV